MLVISIFIALLPIGVSDGTYRPKVSCDDGASPYDRRGRPNIDCAIDGCWPDELICWSDRLDHCFSDDGEDLGVCLFTTSTCGSWHSCFDLFLYCDGQWGCNSSSWGVCTNGYCITSTPAHHA